MQAAIKSHAKLYFLLDDGELLRIILRPGTGGSNVTIDLVDPMSPSLTRWQLPTGEFRSTSSPVSANPHDVETRKKKMLEHLSLGKFEEVPCDLPTPPFAGP